MLIINCERSKKKRKISVLDITNHRSEAVRGGEGGGLPLDLLVVEHWKWVQKQLLSNKCINTRPYTKMIDNT